MPSAVRDKRAYSIRLTGTAHMIGHPLDGRNADIRQKLIKAFSAWYFKHNDENDPHMCYVRIDLSEGFFHKDGMGYTADFIHREAEAFPFGA